MMALSTRYNLYKYLVMSFGMMNEPVHFMYLMNSMFMSELDKYVMIFIDDILVYSKSIKITSMSCFNDYESTSCTSCSASANSGLMKCHSWVM
jgi:hypothetical protein